MKLIKQRIEELKEQKGVPQNRAEFEAKIGRSFLWNALNASMRDILDGLITRSDIHGEAEITSQDSRWKKSRLSFWDETMRMCLIWFYQGTPYVVRWEKDTLTVSNKSVKAKALSKQEQAA